MSYYSVICILLFVGLSCVSSVDVKGFQNQLAINSRDTGNTIYSKVLFYSNDLTGTSCVQTNNHQVRSSRHHVIPRSFLVKFMNFVFSKYLYGRLPLFWQSIPGLICYLMSTYATNDNFFFGADRRMRSMVCICNGLATDDCRNIRVNEFRSAPVDATTNELARMLMFLPFNLFEGPTERSDDPGDNFEVNARYLMPPRQYELIENIYRDMQKVLEIPPESYFVMNKEDRASCDIPETRALFERLDGNLRRANLEFRDPVRLEPTAWIRGADGRYKINHVDQRRRRRSVERNTCGSRSTNSTAFESCKVSAKCP